MQNAGGLVTELKMDDLITVATMNGHVMMGIKVMEERLTIEMDQKTQAFNTQI